MQKKSGEIFCVATLILMEVLYKIEGKMFGETTELVVFESIWERAKGIGSPHLPKEHVRILFEVGQNSNGIGVEIGFWLGRSKALIGSGVRSSGGRLYSIDHWNKIAGGIMIMHDINRPEHPGCIKVWREEVVDSKYWTVLIDSDGFGMARRNY